MNDAIRRMLEGYDLRGVGEQELALREILQEVTLTGLWRAKFFEHAAFYGGTALRILYGLDRFSEDLDFTLLAREHKFSWTAYARAVVDELAAYGFTVTMQEKKKRADTAIKSAFLKSNTVEELLKIGVQHSDLKRVHPESLIRIKVEIDTEPCVDYQVEQRFLENPIAVPIKSVSEEYMFAGKTHAAFFRAWKGRVKGRDWYDLVWFIRRGTRLNLDIFSRMMGEDVPLNERAFRALAHERVAQLDVGAAMQDIVGFVRDRQAVEEVWSKEFFLHWLDRLVVQQQPRLDG